MWVTARPHPMGPTEGLTPAFPVQSRATTCLLCGGGHSACARACALVWTMHAGAHVRDVGACVRGRFMGLRLQVRQPPEPTDVIWENVQSRAGNRCIRSTITFVVTILFLCIRYDV